MPTSLIHRDDSDDSLLASNGPDTLQMQTTIQPEPGLPSIPGYELLQELGRGGMGIVYKARDLKLKRLVAIKMLLDPEYASPEQRLRFKIEAEAVAQLRHPNIVQVYELGEMPGGASGIPHPYMVLEYVEGTTLFRYMRQHPFKERDAAALMITLARAIQHAHDHGLIHRDLKPANILLMEDAESSDLSPEQQARPSSTHSTQHLELSEWRAKIADFGLVKALGHDAEGRRNLTRTELMVGTPQYMAPEQAHPKPVPLSCSVDIYSLGVIFYELLTGQLPYDDGDILQMLMEMQVKEPASPRSLKPRLSIDLETICLKCLEKDPSARYPSAAALADDLTRFLRHEPIQARPLSEWQRMAKWARRHPAIATLAGLLFSVITAALIVIAILWRQADADRREAVQQYQHAEWARDAARTAETQARSAEGTAQQSEKQAQHLLYLSRIAQTDLLLRQGDLLRARQILRDMEQLKLKSTVDPRGWEWFHLTRLCNPMEQMLTEAHDYVQKVVFHPSRPVLFAIQGAQYYGDHSAEQFPGKVHVYELDPDTGRWLYHHQHSWRLPLRDMRLALQGTRMLLTDVSDQIHVLDMERVLDAHQVLSFTTLPANHDWALAEDAGTVALWNRKDHAEDVKLFDMKQMQITQTVKLPAGMVNASISSQGELLTFCLQDYSMGVWNVKGNQLCWRTHHPPGRYMNAISRNGSQAAWLNVDTGDIAWMDARTGKHHLTQKVMPGDSLFLSPEGDRLAYLAKHGDGQEMVVWRRYPTGSIDSIPIHLRGHQGDISSKQFNSTGDRILSTGFDGTVRLWDCSMEQGSTGKCLQIFRGHTGTALAAAFDPLGGHIASCGIDANVLVWNIDRNVTRDHYAVGDGFSGEWLSGYQFIKGTSLLVLFDQMNGKLLHLDLKKRKIGKKVMLDDVFTGFRAPRFDSAFTPDGKYLAATNKNGERIHLYDTQTGQRVWTSPQADFKPVQVRISGDGKRLLFAGVLPVPGVHPARAKPYQYIFQVWDLATKELLQQVHLQSAVQTLNINHNGTRIAAVLMNPQRQVNLALFPVDDKGKLLYQVPIDFTRAMSLAFSPDNQSIAMVNFDPVKTWITLRDAASGKEIWKSNTRPETIDVMFTPDSRRVLFTSYDSNVVMLDVQNGHEVITLKHHGNPRMNNYALSPKMVFNHDATCLAIHSWDAGLTVWHAYHPDSKETIVIPPTEVQE